MAWSTVSNAALKSKSIKITESPESTDNRMSFKTLNSADSVLWFVLKPDWNLSRIILASRKLCNCSSTVFSRILAMKGRLEIGLKFYNSVVSKLGLFNIGLTIACLQRAGTEPKRRLLLIINMIHAPTLSNICLKKWVGAMSREEVVGFKLVTLSVRQDMVIGWREFKNLVAITGSAGSTDEGNIDRLITTIWFSEIIV